MLDERPMYGLELKNGFEARTGGVWPLNVGQVYTTLGRLERDGLVALHSEDGGNKAYVITDEGRILLGEWFDSPLRSSAPPRDEVVLKMLLAASKPNVDVTQVIQAERRAAIEQLQGYTRLKTTEPNKDDLGWMMLLDSLIFKAEARVRWLDVCEARIAQQAPGTGRTSMENQPGWIAARDEAVPDTEKDRQVL